MMINSIAPTKFYWFALCLIATSVIISLSSAQNVAPTVGPVCEPVTAKPAPETKKYVFKSCIVAQFATYLSIGGGKYFQLTNGTVNQNSSNCENNNSTPIAEPKLVIDFDCGSLSFSISHNDSKTYVKSIDGRYTLNPANSTANSTATIVTFSNSTPTFSTTLSGHYYKCNAEQAIPVKLNNTLILSNFALEAFRDAPGTDFYQIPEECPLDSQPVSDLVRIGVGVCLIALVAIVLIAYFIGRRRWSERSSYESV